MYPDKFFFILFSSCMYILLSCIKIIFSFNHINSDNSIYCRKSELSKNLFLVYSTFILHIIEASNLYARLVSVFFKNHFFLLLVLFWDKSHQSFSWYVDFVFYLGTNNNLLVYLLLFCFYICIIVPAKKKFPNSF